MNACQGLRFACLASIESLKFNEVLNDLHSAVYDSFFAAFKQAWASRCRIDDAHPDSQENFKKVHLKAATAIAHIPVVGDFTIKLENVKLTALEVDDSSTGVSLGQDGTFVLLVSGLAAVVEGHFQWRRNSFPFISGGCQTRVTAEVRTCYKP